MSDAIACISCGMPMREASDHAPGKPDSAYCRYCSTAEGELQPFTERFERMVQWEMRQKGADRAAAEAATRAYMRQLPAWRDRPELA